MKKAIEILDERQEQVKPARNLQVGLKALDQKDYDPKSLINDERLESLMS
ncbi:MAG: hypothetical protein NZ937_00260 [Armatimonadetes bacterium]|nr:hypothetical protein [Armatimonadota bacterium]